MKGVFEGLVAVGVLAASVVADGTPVLAARATTTVTPITVTGNGMQPKDLLVISTFLTNISSIL